MSVKFSIAKRGTLPTEQQQQTISEETERGRLRVVLECPMVTDVVEFQSGSARLPSVLPKGELLSSISLLRSVMLHEFEKGNAVSLPGIGTFRLSLKGDVEVKDGSYRGRDVRVDGLQFRPDNSLLAEIRQLEVDQVPYGMDFRTKESGLEARLEEIFKRQDFITHKDVAVAFGQTLTRNRITNLLGSLVQSGRLVREGKGAQARYRLP